MYTACHDACTLKLKAARACSSGQHAIFVLVRPDLGCALSIIIITFRPVISTANTKLGQKYVNK